VWEGRETAERQILAVLFLSGLVLSALAGSARGKVPLSWGVERIRAYCVWDNDNWNMTDPWDVDAGANAGQNTIIAVIDTGVDYYTDDQYQIHYHPDLAPNIAGGKGFAFYAGQLHIVNDHQDTTGHGTRVIGVIAATVNGTGANASGIVGAAPQTRIYVLKYFGGLVEEVVAAIYYAVDVLDANIISMSWGYDYPDSRLFDACNYAYNHGALLFAASGNENRTIHEYPALYDSVEAVGATCQDDSRWSFSDYGPKLCFVAPGFEINTTHGNTTQHFSYAVVSGTSFAAPYAVAAAALIWTSKPDPGGGFGSQWTNVGVYQKMRTNGTLDLWPTGRDNDTGWGLVNAWLSNQRPIGDINNDLRVSGDDVALAQYAFGSYPGHPRWDPRADMNINNRVDGTDVAWICRHFGESDP
jgi:subtilisin family serine protease